MPSKCTYGNNLHLSRKIDLIECLKVRTKWLNLIGSQLDTHSFNQNVERKQLTVIVSNAHTRIHTDIAHLDAPKRDGNMENGLSSVIIWLFYFINKFHNQTIPSSYL